MQRALELAKIAEQQDEVPVGAVVVYQNKIIGEGYNQPIRLNDPTAHAEVIALRQSAKNIGNYRLIDTSMYVTLEPCSMCVGAMVHARIKQLFFAAGDAKTGAVCGAHQLVNHPMFNHQIEWHQGLLGEVSSQLLKDFFAAKRAVL